MLVIKNVHKAIRTLLEYIYYDPAGKNIDFEGRRLVLTLLDSCRHHNNHGESWRTNPLVIDVY